MNERIRQLAEQADVFEYKTYYDPTFSKSVINDDKVKKFAELIVRECANMAESFHHHQYDFTGNLELHEFIKEHFGVEE